LPWLSHCWKTYNEEQTPQVGASFFCAYFSSCCDLCGRTGFQLANDACGGIVVDDIATMAPRRRSNSFQKALKLGTSVCFFSNL
jgi:hypothetical protein